MSTAERAGSDGPQPKPPVNGRPPGIEGAPKAASAVQTSHAPGRPQPSQPPPSALSSPPTAQPRATVLRGTVRIGQRHITVRRLDPWTILKLSVVFYTVLLLMFMLLLTLFWAFVNTIGAVDTVLGFLEDAQFEVRIDAGEIARAIFLLGLLGVVAASGINVFFCFLYNLVADLTGGLRLTIDDDR